MLAAVLLMQPLAQLTAQGIELGALSGISSHQQLDPSEMYREKIAPDIDATWQLVVGVDPYQQSLLL